MRHGEQLAQQVATVDALAGGRFVLGVGTGPSGAAAKADFHYAAAEFSTRAETTVEVVQRARQLWRGEGLPHGAERLQPLTTSPSGPPVWMGGAGPLSRRRAGQLFDGWFPLATDPSTYASGIEDVRAAAVELGRDVKELTAAAYLTINIGTSETAQRELAQHIELYYGQPLHTMTAHMGVCAGTEEQVSAWLQAFIDAGCRHICLRLASVNYDVQLDRLANVLPAVRSTASDHAVPGSSIRNGPSSSGPVGRTAIGQHERRVAHRSHYQTKALLAAASWKASSRVVGGRPIRVARSALSV